MVLRRRSRVWRTRDAGLCQTGRDGVNSPLKTWPTPWLPRRNETARLMASALGGMSDAEVGPEPPQYVTFREAARAEMLTIRTEMTELRGLHGRATLSRFDESNDDEIQVQHTWQGGVCGLPWFVMREAAWGAVVIAARLLDPSTLVSNAVQEYLPFQVNMVHPSKCHCTNRWR